MSTKTETKTTNQYDPTSMSNYHQNNTGATNVFSDYMKDPLKASYFQNQVNILNRTANQIGQRNVSNLTNNANLTGGGVMPGYMQSMLARTGRDTGAMQAQNFLTALMTAESNRRGAANMAIQDRPLQTGQDTTQQKSGLGTWLPQVIGAGVGLAGSFLTKGKGSGGSGDGGGGGDMSSWGGSVGGSSAPSYWDSNAGGQNQFISSGMWSGYNPMANVTGPGGYNPEGYY